MQRANESFLVRLAKAAEQNIKDGYYHNTVEGGPKPRRSLKDALLNSPVTPVIAEIKFVSPAEGKLREREDVAGIARAYARGGVSAISVLTEPKNFDGDISFLPVVKSAVRVPVMMKDIIIDPLQAEAGQRAGADALLLIMSIFRKRLAHLPLDEMVSVSHGLGLQVLLEAHNEDEFKLALDTEADLVGINNRNLETLEVSLETSRDLLRGYRHGKPVVCESGIGTAEQMKELRALGADGFLIGSAIMKSGDIEAKVRALTGA